MIDRHSAIAHAGYHDLLRSLLDDTVSDLRGAPTLLKRNGRGNWID
jgi:hypothetical protein